MIKARWLGSNYSSPALTPPAAHPPTYLHVGPVDPLIINDGADVAEVTTDPPQALGLDVASGLIRVIGLQLWLERAYPALRPDD